MKLRTLASVLLLFSLAILFNSCKDDDEGSPKPSDENEIIEIDLNPEVEVLEKDVEYPVINIPTKLLYKESNKPSSSGRTEATAELGAISVFIVRGKAATGSLFLRLVRVADNVPVAQSSEIDIPNMISEVIEGGCTETGQFTRLRWNFEGTDVMLNEETYRVDVMLSSSSLVPENETASYILWYCNMSGENGPYLPGTGTSINRTQTTVNHFKAVDYMFETEIVNSSDELEVDQANNSEFGCGFIINTTSEGAEEGWINGQEFVPLAN